MRGDVSVQRDCSLWVSLGDVSVQRDCSQWVSLGDVSVQRDCSQWVSLGDVSVQRDCSQWVSLGLMHSAADVEILLPDSSVAPVACNLDDETSRAITEFRKHIAVYSLKVPYVNCLNFRVFSQNCEHLWFSITSDHDVMDRRHVTGFESAGEYSVALNYTVSLDQLISFIDEDDIECRQFIKWECRSATIKNIQAPTIAVTYWANRCVNVMRPHHRSDVLGKQVHQRNSTAPSQ